MTRTKAPDKAGLIDAATVALPVSGVLCGNLVGLPPDAQFA